MSDIDKWISELIEELNQAVACKTINEVTWDKLYFGKFTHSQTSIVYVSAYLNVPQFQLDPKISISGNTKRIKIFIGRFDQFDPTDSYTRLKILNAIKKSGKEKFGC